MVNTDGAGGRVSAKIARWKLLILQSAFSAGCILCAAGVRESAEQVVKPSEDVHGDRMLVAEVAFQDVQRLDEVVAGVDFIAAGFLKLGEITEGVAERRVIRVQFLFSQIDCFRIKAFGLIQLLPALMFRTLLEQVGNFGQCGALRVLLGKLFSQLGYLFDV